MECIFPGSFDPVTKGHMDLIERASARFDKVYVVVMINIRKQGCFSPEKRKELLEKATAGFPNVVVDMWEGLLADYAGWHPGAVIIRGVRNAAEFDAEYTSAQANRLLNPNAETLIFPARKEYSCISSSAVREIASFHGDIRPFLPENVAEEIVSLLSK